MRKLKRDKVISVVEGKDLVGVYFADTNGAEVLMECSPKKADRIIEIWNKKEGEDRRYSIIIKSHCEASDWEDECFAEDIDEAIEKFKRRLKHFGFDREWWVRKILEEEKCKKCNGTGEVNADRRGIDGNTCEICNGQGWKEVVK